MTIERDDDDRRKKKYPLIYDDYQSPDYPGLYFAGTNTHSLDFRKSAGGFIHGFRYTGTAHVPLQVHRYSTRLQIHRYCTRTASNTQVQLQLLLVDTVLTKI